MTTSIESAPTLLILFNFIFLFSGLVVFTWGKKLPSRGSWVIWAMLLLLLAGVGLDTGLFFNQEFKIKIWSAGWFWPKEDLGAVTVGIMHDSLSFAMSTLAAIVAGGLLLNQGFLMKESKPEQVYAAIAVSTAGVTLAWNSLTPWMVFAGLILTILGGFISLGTRWDANAEALIATRFAWERASGFLFAFFGTCILSATRPALLINQAGDWLTQVENVQATWTGAILLVVGLFIQLQPFPLMGGLVVESEIYPPTRTLLNQIFPAWAAFALLLRLEPQLRGLGLFPAFGWVALGSCILTLFSGLLLTSWRKALAVWLAAGLSLCCALLAFSGPLSATGMLLGVSIGSLCLSVVASALEGDVPQSVPNKKKATWLKMGSFLGVAAGTGVIGFVSATSGLRWIIQSVNVPSVVAAFLFVFFLYVLLGWKMAWKVSQLQTASEASWLSIVAVFLWVILSVAVVWTGTATGEVIPGDPDRLFRSFFGEFFGARTDVSHSEEYLTASGLYWGALLLAFLGAYWTSGRKEDQWVRIAAFFPRTTRFLRSGYGVDTGVARVTQGVVWLGRATEKLIDQKIWSKWIPNGLSSGVRTSSRLLTQIDAKVSFHIGGFLRKFVDVPAKILQLIQTGDIRWYLLFALGSGFALLSHFLRT